MSGGGGRYRWRAPALSSSAFLGEDTFRYRGSVSWSAGLLIPVRRAADHPFPTRETPSPHGSLLICTEAALTPPAARLLTELADGGHRASRDEDQGLAIR